MTIHQIAFICSGVLVVPLAFMQVAMRRQVHNASYGSGSSEVSPWHERFVNPVFGKHGIWNLHKKAYERSALRSAFIVLSDVWLVSVLVGMATYLVNLE